METRIKVAALLSIVCILLSGCATLPQPATDMTLPKRFNDVWYRSHLVHRSIVVMEDTGILTVHVNGISFIGGDGTLDIDYEKIQEVNYGKMGFDITNHWTTVKYHNGKEDSYALFSGGKLLGWGGIGVGGRIFQAIKFALDQKGLGSVVVSK